MTTLRNETILTGGAGAGAAGWQVLAWVWEGFFVPAGYPPMPDNVALVITAAVFAGAMALWRFFMRRMGS